MISSVKRLYPALLLALALPAAVQAAVYTPTKGTDTNDGACDADCSLREAIVAANQHPGEDAVLLHAGIYTLSAPGPATGNLEIQGNLVLIGDGAERTVIDGGAVDGIFYVPGGVTVQIQDVTLRNGRSPGAGGAIRNSGDLTLLRTILTGNASVAGAAGAGLGGAIVTDGHDASLTIRDSSIVNNTAQSAGGGIAAGGDLTLANVTISGNRSTADFGGGLYLFSDIRATANNISVVGNTAALKGGGLFVENSAFIGISPRITNSLFFNPGGSDPDCSGAIDSAYNLISNNMGCFGPSAANHDKVGTPASPLLARTGALANYGGPTPTIPAPPRQPRDRRRQPRRARLGQRRLRGDRSAGGQAARRRHLRHRSLRGDGRMRRGGQHPLPRRRPFPGDRHLADVDRQRQRHRGDPDAGQRLLLVLRSGQRGGGRQGPERLRRQQPLLALRGRPDQRPRRL